MEEQYSDVVLSVSTPKSLSSMQLPTLSAADDEKSEAVTANFTAEVFNADMEEETVPQTGKRNSKLQLTVNGVVELCTCETDCPPGASNIMCTVHGINPEYRSKDGDQSVIDVSSEMIGAIKEYHGHKRFDINNHVKKNENLEIENEVMRTAINGVLHMGGSNYKARQRMQELADQISDIGAGGAAINKQAMRKELRKKKESSTNSVITSPVVSTKSKTRQNAPAITKPVKIKSVKAYSKKFPPMDPWEKCKNDSNVKCLCRLPRPKPDPVPSHRLRCKSMKPPPDKIPMPLQPPPLGYRWSYRRYAANNEAHKLVDHRHYITPPFKWVLVPTNLKIKRKKTFDYIKDAKYGYRNQMDPKDFSLVNYYNFPPYCYSIVEPLRFPYENFNSPPFPKRAPLHFVHGKFDDKITTSNDKERVRLFKGDDVKLTKKDVRRLTMEQLNKKRRLVDTEDDAWAGYKPKFIKSPINRVWKFNWQASQQDPPSVPKRLKLSVRETDITPIVSTRPLVKGQSPW